MEKIIEIKRANLNRKAYTDPITGEQKFIEKIVFADANGHTLWISRAQLAHNLNIAYDQVESSLFDSVYNKQTSSEDCLVLKVECHEVGDIIDKDFIVQKEGMFVKDFRFQILTSEGPAQDRFDRKIQAIKDKGLVWIKAPSKEPALPAFIGANDMV